MPSLKKWPPRCIIGALTTKVPGNITICISLLLG
jgi:hypothetical protein